MDESCYITGTDTDIGKTHVAAWMIRQQVAAGYRAVGMKPVASGCLPGPGGWRSADAEALMTASNVDVPYSDVNPYALPLPVAPEIAAARAGIRINRFEIEAAFQRLHAQSEIVVVEGVGGWMAPITDELDQAEVVQTLGLPVVMVVGMRLGCVHQARVTARAIRNDAVRLKGWVANEVDPAMSCYEENVEIVSRVLGMPPMAELYWEQASAPHIGQNPTIA